MKQILLLLNFTSSDAPLALYQNSSGILIPLTRQKFIARLNRILELRHLLVITGHCLRIGGTTHLLLSQILPDIIKLLGHWSSDAFLWYWHSLEIITPLYIKLLAPILRYSGWTHHSASREVISSSNACCSSRSGYFHTNHTSWKAYKTCSLPKQWLACMDMIIGP